MTDSHDDSATNVGPKLTVAVWAARRTARF
jgi:hypothetical protein